ncbi:MAG: hypothetical protein J6V09_00820 [Clostridia bacterium]|nr:hypothetical protein [Clostridia bacterium]
MKKILSLLVLVAIMLTFTSCGGYEPVKSSDTEAQTVMTIKFEDKTYEVRYELYRALFLNLKSSVDGGDASVWTGENKDQYIQEIDALIKARVCDIYSVLHHAKKIGIDPYGKKYDEMVREYIQVSVDGGYYYNDIKIEGFGKDYGKYLAYLKSVNLNYSVQDLLLRYSQAMEDIFYYYAGTMGEFLDDVKPGKLEYTRADVEEFYFGGDCVRVIRGFWDSKYCTPEQAEKYRKGLSDVSYSEELVVDYLSGKMFNIGGLKDGEIYAKYNLDTFQYADEIAAAFATPMFEVSEVIEVNTVTEAGYAVLYRAAKTTQHFDNCYESIADAYVHNEIGKIIDTAAAEMLESIAYTSVLDDINRADISMDN